MPTERRPLFPHSQALLDSYATVIGYRHWKAITSSDRECDSRQPKILSEIIDNSFFSTQFNAHTHPHPHSRSTCNVHTRGTLVKGKHCSVSVRWEHEHWTLNTNMKCDIISLDPLNSCQKSINWMKRKPLVSRLFMFKEPKTAYSVCPLTKLNLM